MYVCMKISFVMKDWSEINKHDWIINESALYLNLKKNIFYLEFFKHSTNINVKKIVWYMLQEKW